MQRELAQPVNGAGKLRLVDQLLMRLHPRHVRVAEQRHVRRFQARGPFDHRQYLGLGLQRQPVHQVEVDVLDTVPAQPPHDTRDHRERLQAVDRALHIRIEVLHADRGAVDAGRGQRRDVLLRRVPRVEFDRDLGAGREVESLAQESDQRQPVLRRQHGRAAAAEMQMANGEALRQRVRDQRDLPVQGGQVGTDRLVAVDYLGVATAEPAHRVAERDADVERQRHRRIELTEPVAIARPVDPRAEMWRRGITGVAGNTQIVSFGKLGRHLTGARM
jgi:hypothetical protein